MSKAGVILGNLRKDYVLEKFVILPDSHEDNILSDAPPEKCPYCPGNESMTGPAVISLVSKDGMLQRLSDSEESVIEDWCVRVFQSQSPAVTTVSQNKYSDKPLYSEPAYGYHQVVVASPEHRQDLSKISVEHSGPRQILATDSFLAFSPWASTYPYEFWIYPKRHTTTFSKVPQKEISDLALMLRATIGGMSKGLKTPPYNLVCHLYPEKKNSRQIHWHIEVYPQTNKWSGLQRGFGIYVNAVSPESSAEVLGSACRKELAGLVGIT